MSTPLGRIRLLLLDVDGVLTDGGIIYSDTGEQIKSFNSRDGLGIRLLMDAGVLVGVVTGRKSGALTHRCQNLGIGLLFDGIENKAAALDTIIDQTGIAAQEIAFIGDDLPDLPIMKRVGVAVCVQDAPEEVKIHSRFVTQKKGGQGAVREICEAILREKGVWQTIVGRYA